MQENQVWGGSPVYLPAGTINEIGARVTVAGSAGALIRLGVYSLDGLDGALVWDAGTIDGTSATTQTITGGTATITAGWYLLGGGCQGDPATRPTIYRNTGIAPFTWHSQADLAGQIAFPAPTGVFLFGISGALPATATFFLDGGRAVAQPRVGVKGTWT
jgi:hypothetical protein